MVNAADSPLPDRLSTKALAAAGQFRAIALWLNEPLIPEGIYTQVCQDKRPGCIRVTVEFERPPLQKPLTQYICHLMWQLNSPLIEGIHLLARPIGTTKPLWQQRVRVMTPALKERLRREQGQGTPAAAMPPPLVSRPAKTNTPGLSLHLLAEQTKSLRAFMLTGSAVAAFVFGCLLEVVMSSQAGGPSLPFQERIEADANDRPAHRARSTSGQPAEPQLPAFRTDESPTMLADRPQTNGAAFETTAVSYKTEPERDRPNVVNAALEPVGVLQHERLELPQDPTITLLFGGDVDLDGLPYDQLEHDGQLLSGLPAYRQADIAMVNLQDPLTPSATSLEEEFLERERPEAINLLKAGGVDLVNLTGENALAFGEHGLAETLDTLDRHGIFRVGAGRSEREARRPEIVDVKGQRIAYLSYDRDFSLAAGEDLSGVNAVAMKDIITDIQAIRDEVDWLVVNYRWSAEPPATPAESQTNLAQLAIDQGADLVVGQHPSQLQGAELYKGRPIAYSLGDFVYGSTAEDPTPETAVLQVAIRAGQMKVDLIPVKVKNGQPQKANGADAERILAKIRAASEAFREPMPPSVVLDMRSGAGGVPVEAEGDGFTADEPPAEVAPESTVDPVDPAPAEMPETPDESLPVDDAAPEPEDAEPMPTESLPAAETAEPEMEIDAFPDDLLKDWGPKDSPNTIYEPDEPASRLPRELPQKPAKPQPADSQMAPEESPDETDETAEDGTPAETAPPGTTEDAAPAVPAADPSPPPASEKPDPATADPAAPTATPDLNPKRHSPPESTTPTPPAEPQLQEMEQSPDNGAIAPYSEPLVGPMSALPKPELKTDADMKRVQDPIAPPAVRPGMPETRVYEPLNLPAAESEAAVTVDVDKSDAIAQTDASSSP